MAPDEQFDQSRREVGQACMQARDLLGPVLQYREGQLQGGAVVTMPAAIEARPRKITMVNGDVETINAAQAVVNDHWVYLYEGDRQVFAAPEIHVLCIRNASAGDTAPVGGKARTP